MKYIVSLALRKSNNNDIKIYYILCQNLVVEFIAQFLQHNNLNDESLKNIEVSKGNSDIRITFKYFINFTEDNIG